MDWSEADRMQREKLERASPSAPRRNLVDILNEGERQRTASEMPGLDAIAKVRNGQRYGYRTAADHNRAHARFEKSEAFNRLHPGALKRTMPTPVGSSGWPVGPRSDFNFDERDPGNRDGSRFGHNEKFDPPQRAGRVRDSEGELRSDHARARDHWASGRVEPVDTEWMLDAARALIEAVRSRRYAQGKV